MKATKGQRCVLFIFLQSAKVHKDHYFFHHSKSVESFATLGGRCGENAGVCMGLSRNGCDGKRGIRQRAGEGGPGIG